MVEGDEATRRRGLTASIYKYIDALGFHQYAYLLQVQTDEPEEGSTFSAQSNWKLQQQKIRATCVLGFVAVCKPL